MIRLCLAALLLTAGPARAQFPDLLDVSVNYLPATALEDPRPARAQLTAYEISVNVPIPLGPKSFLIPGVSYHADAVSYADAPPQLDRLRLFHSVALPLLFVQLLPRDWSLSLRVAPSLAGDFEAVDAGLFDLDALALATHSFSDQFVLGGGGITSFAFGSFLVLPALYLDWRPWPGGRVEAFLPAFVQVGHTFAERVEVGVRAEVSGNSYAVRDDRVRDGPACSGADRDTCLDHLAYSLGAVGLTAGVRLVDSLWLTLFASRTVHRRFEPLNERDETIPGGPQRLPDAFSFRTHLTWRLPSG